MLLHFISAIYLTTKYTKMPRVEITFRILRGFCFPSSILEKYIKTWMRLWLLNYLNQLTLCVVWNSNTILLIEGRFSEIFASCIFAIENDSIHATVSGSLFGCSSDTQDFPQGLLWWQWHTEKLRLFMERWTQRGLWCCADWSDNRSIAWLCIYWFYIFIYIYIYIYDIYT